jgi:two-component system phosphate regulon sensor histidine kinase PhoR
MLRGVRWRIGIPYVLLILFTMIGLGIYLSQFARQTYQNNLETQLIAEAKLAGDVIAETLAIGDETTIIDEFVHQWAEQLGIRFTVIALDGLVLGESHEDATKMDNHGSRPEIIQARENGQGTSTRYSKTLDDYLMYVAVPIKYDDELVGYMRVAVPLVDIEENIRHLQRTLIGATFLATLIAIILALWIANRTLRPLRELTKAVGQISGGQLDDVEVRESYPLRSTDEIGRLTRAFNDMAVQLRSQIDALESERSKIADVLDVMNDGVLIVDAQGDIQLINPAAESMFEVEEKLALGEPVIEILRHHQIAEMFQLSRETNERQFATIEISSRNLYLQGVATPLGKGEPGNFLLLFQNLTRVRQLETVRQDFISNISHELRTPLASLKALTETLQEGAMDDPPAAKRFLQLMETEVDALSLIVLELLELSRIESGRVPIKMSPTSAHELINRAIERLDLQARRAGLSIYISCPPNLPDVLADEIRLEQVLVNLLHNAIKFTPTGGEIHVNAEIQNDTVIFSVQDSGIGIPQEDLTRIFERFYKTDRARSSGGTGLGLAISKHLVESHGGSIWVESIEGRGSSFYFTIPVLI